MIKHNFKIGDKVSLKGSSYCGVSGNDIGVVTSLHCYIEVLWQGYLGKKLGCYPHKPNEIEHAIKVGEQLLFSFMSEATK